MPDSPLAPVMWAAIAVLGVCGITLVTCLNILANTHRPKLLPVVWIASSLGIAALVALVLVLVQG